jgi:hypothetical protein
LNAVLQRPDLFSDDDFARLKNVERERWDCSNGGSVKSLSESKPSAQPLGARSSVPCRNRQTVCPGLAAGAVVYGIAGFIIAGRSGFFAFTCRTSAAQYCRAELIAPERAVAKPLPKGERLPGAGDFAQSQSVAVVGVAIRHECGLTFFVTSLPRYLMDVHQTDPGAKLDGFDPSPCWNCRDVPGGRLTDVPARRIGLRWGRALLMD